MLFLFHIYVPLPPGDSLIRSQKNIIIITIIIIIIIIISSKLLKNVQRVIGLQLPHISTFHVWRTSHQSEIFYCGFKC
jgi:Mn2+/Fe2+ NRAMP family transporter